MVDLSPMVPTPMAWPAPHRVEPVFFHPTPRWKPWILWRMVHGQARAEEAIDMAITARAFETEGDVFGVPI